MSDEKLEFPFEFEMSLPEFGTHHGSQDGNVLYLDELITSESNVVILKNFAKTDFVQLIVSSPLLDNGIVSASVDNSPADSAMHGYHFYSFPDEITVYAEQALQILPLI